MVRNLKIDNFKCFDLQQVEFSHFNLLTGPNSTGKSTVIQSLLLLYQTLRQEEYIKLGSFGDMKNMYTSRKMICISAETTNGDLEVVLKQPDEQLETMVRENGPDLSCMVYLNAERTGVEEVYPRNTRDERLIGVGGEFAFAYLSKFKLEPIQQKEFIKSEEAGEGFSNQVNYWLDYILGYQINVEVILDTDLVKVTYSKKNSSRQLRPINVGTGVTYVANLVVSALSCRVDDLFMVENPEIHLHPGAQARVAEFLIFLASKGLQVVVESHSDHIYNGLRRCIKNCEIDRTQTRVYYFETGDDGKTFLTKIPIRADGAEEVHPMGLFDQIDEDMDELLGL